MTLIDIPAPIALEVVHKMAMVDEGAAMLLVELGTYEALCDEADRMRPYLEREHAKDAVHKLDGALETVAKRYAAAKLQRANTSELEQMAAELSQMREINVEIAKYDPNEARSSDGRWTSRGVRGSILNLLGIAQQGGPKGAGDSLGTGGYDNLRALGEGLTAARAPGASAVSTVASYGPEAQRALEPGIRRTAYRYRGTERRPSGELVNNAKTISLITDPGALEQLQAAAQQGNPSAVRTMARITALQSESNDSKTAETRQVAAPVGRRVAGGGQLSSVAAALEFNQRGSEDQRRLGALGDYGALSLRKQVPDLETAKLSLAAGKLPPSVGLLFDADGALVSEAQGFNGDHYLPFDLKNLKRLKGGQYVRTRTTGGLTDEDVYTGLMTGARQVQVISNSGVFTLEFDPSLRGGRRYSDKARQMVDRYQKLTAAVGSNSVVRTDLKPEQVSAIRQQVLSRYGAGNPTLLHDKVEEALREERLKATFDAPDEAELEQAARNQAQAEYRQGQVEGGNKPKTSERAYRENYASILRDLTAKAREDQVRNYRLDGEGYGSAMKALKQEFPYFIRRADFIPLHDYLTSRKAYAPGEELKARGGADIGYTEPGKLGPRGRIGNETDEQRSERTTGRAARTPAAAVAPAAAGPAATSTSAARTSATSSSAPSAARSANLPDPEALSFEELAKQNQAAQKRDLTVALRSSIAVYDNLQGPLEGMDADMVQAPNDSPLVTGAGPEQYAEWVLKQGTLSQYVDILLNDKTGAHKRALTKSLDHLKMLAGRGKADSDAMGFTAEKFDEAKDLLEVSGGGNDLFATSENPVLSVPDSEDPKPPAFSDILAAGASPENMVYLARVDNDPKVLEYAQQFSTADDRDGAAVETITPEAIRLEALISWGKSDRADRAPAGYKVSDYTMARGLAEAPEQNLEYRDLAAKQRAWALVKAHDAAVAMKAGDPVSFGDAGPKVVAAKRHRSASRVRMLPVDSPVTKALAARRSQSGRVGTRPARR